VQAFRAALEKSVTISRDLLQEVVDDAVRRGRMTRKDAEELVARLVTRGREQADDLIRELDRLVEPVRSGIETRTAPARDRASAARTRAAKRVRDAADQPLARADRVRRQAGIGGFPITAYDQLSVRQINGRLPELSEEQLRRVHEYERGKKARKGILQQIERRLKD
jgi:polyhydroxyalkanoate synthesis regulator phasin